MRAPHAGLTPPDMPLARGYTWEQFPLRLPGIGIRARAIGQYGAELRAVGWRYPAFARGNELFMRA